MRKCIMCGETFMPLTYNQTTCGKKECKDIRNRKNRKESRAKNGAFIPTEQRCIICNEIFIATKVGRVTCGKERCKRERQKLSSRESARRRRKNEPSRHRVRSAWVDPKIRKMSDTNVEIINWSMREKGMTFRQAAAFAGWGNETDIVERRLWEKGYKVTADGIEIVQKEK